MMDVQPLRRRASGTTRGDVSSEQPTVLLGTSSGLPSTVPTTEKEVTSGEEPKASNHQDSSSAQSKSQWVKAAWVAVAVIVFSLTLVVLYDSHSQWIFTTLYGQNHDRGSSIGIKLHPENHVYRAPAVIEHHWSISSGYRAPDGVRKRIYLINGAFPGPTVEVRQGDFLRVHVQNDLHDEGLSIHWHGLNMKGTNEMDGAVGFTQCPIPEGGNFTYEFQIDDLQSGTFWYHAHSQVQRADGLYGGLIVHRALDQGSELESEEYGYDTEILLLVGDWYHRSAKEILAWYLNSRSFGNEVHCPYPPYYLKTNYLFFSLYLILL